MAIRDNSAALKWLYLDITDIRFLFSRKNINCSIEESLARFSDVLERAKAAKIKVRG